MSKKRIADRHTKPCKCQYDKDGIRFGVCLACANDLMWEYGQGVEKGMADMAKAFGGCTKCYGKGYSTYRHGISGHPDFYGEKGFEIKPQTHIVFCTCDRGKQLKELWQPVIRVQA